MATAIALRLRVNNNRASCRFINSFSTSGPKTQDEENTTESPPPSQTSKRTSIIDGLRSRLQPQPQPPPQQQQHNRYSYSSRISILNSNSSSVSNLKEIASSLSEFRLTTAPPPPSGVDPTDFVTFEELYNRNIIPEGPKSSNPFGKGGVFSLDKLQEKLRQNKQNATPAATSFSQMSANNINPRPSNPKDDKVWFVSCSHKELGQRLMDLRPEEAKGSNKSFSLEELNKWLMKLREQLDRNQPVSADHCNIVRESISKISEVDLDTSSSSK